MLLTYMIVFSHIHKNLYNIMLHILLNQMVNQKVKLKDNQTVKQNGKNKHLLTTKLAKTQKLTYIIY